MAMSAKRGWVAGGVLALAGLVAGLVVGELGLAWLYPQLYRRPEVWEFDVDLGWRHVPGSSGRLISPEFDVAVAINADGLRDRTHARAKATSVQRIAVFGDSFAEGWGVELEQSVSKRLEYSLNHAKGPQDAGAEVINFGVAGYGTDQELLLYSQLGVRYRPDLVIVLFYANDLWNNVSTRGIGAERGYKPFFRLDGSDRLRLQGVPVRRSGFWDDPETPPAGARERLGWYLGKNWHLFVLARKALSPAVPRGQQRDFYGGLYGRDPLGRYESVWNLTGRILAEFDSRVRREGSQMLLVYCPAIVQVQAEDWRTKRELYGLAGDYDLTKPNRMLAAIADQHDILYLDLRAAFAERPDSGRLYYRDSHWTPDGHEVAAAAIASYLEPGVAYHADLGAGNAP